VKISKEDFKIIRVIGRGTFGKVFLVRHRASGKYYAMKVLKKAQILKKNL
jgi:serine/threonine protein kinase